MVANKQLGQLRIIAGEWRGRPLQFPAESGLRPTHDRIRETLFNWLQADIVDANCLDLFAGSGALGFESLSRGAAHVTMLETSFDVYTSLVANKSKLKAENLTVLHRSFSSELPTLEQGPFDLVFLDPPYHQGWLEKAIAWLCNNELLNDSALVYVEAEAELDLSFVERYLQPYKHKKTRQVQYALYTLEASIKA